MGVPANDKTNDLVHVKRPQVLPKQSSVITALATLEFQALKLRTVAGKLKTVIPDQGPAH